MSKDAGKSLYKTFMFPWYPISVDMNMAIRNVNLDGSIYAFTRLGIQVVERLKTPCDRVLVPISNRIYEQLWEDLEDA